MEQSCGSSLGDRRPCCLDGSGLMHIREGMILLTEAVI
jgi:hypothetical protein